MQKRTELETRIGNRWIKEVKKRRKLSFAERKVLGGEKRKK